MSCGNCNTCSVSEKRGCGTSSTFDWLYQIDNPSSENKNLVEVQFKGDRKDFYINTEERHINKGDFVAVQAEKRGHDIGKITMKGDLVALQIKRKNRDVTKQPLKKIYRKATKSDIEKWEKTIKKESEVLAKAKNIINFLELEMKLSDVEFQADATKATFYYTAEKRVDFRPLIKEYSKEFRVRIEMRQIGVRQEAAKIGGIGSCGRELCCSTWMTGFPAVSTSAVRYQQLAINPQKISGQCGRLKCCLNFELDSYVEALSEFPNTKTRLKTKKGEGKMVKLDVFRKKIFYFYPKHPGDMIAINVKDVNKIISLNKKGVLPEKLEEYEDLGVQKEKDFKGEFVEYKINRFDKKNKKTSKKR